MTEERRKVKKINHQESSNPEDSMDLAVEGLSEETIVDKPPANVVLYLLYENIYYENDTP